MSFAESRDASYAVSLLNPLKDPKPAWEFKTENLSNGTDVIVSRAVRHKNDYDPAHGLAVLKVVELDSDNPSGLLLKALQSYAIYSPYTTILRGVEPDPQTREPVGLSGGRLATALNELQALADENEDIEFALEDILGCMDWVEKFDTSIGANELLSPSVPRVKRMVRFTDRYMVRDRNRLTATWTRL